MYIKAWMSSNFDIILPLTTELAAFQRLNIDVSTRFRLIFIRSFFKLAGKTRTCIISQVSANFGQTRPPTTELAALELLKYPIN